MIKRLLLFSALVLSLNVLSAKNTIQPSTAGLKCDYEINPVGLDDLTPHFSWRLQSQLRNTMQTACQILVASEESLLQKDSGDVWDSGKLAETSSVDVVYGGKELKSRERYYWKVKTWTTAGETAWSEPAFFEMGLLNPQDWNWGWIGYASGMPGRILYFRSIFTSRKSVRSARAYVSGLGFYEFEINHKKVGDNVLDPAQSTCSKHVYYSTYDITDSLKQGTNTLVVSIAPGWYGTPKLRFQMNVFYDDGTFDVVTSNGMRSVTTGPTVYSSVFDGEKYDGRELNSQLYDPKTPYGLMDSVWGFAYNTDEPTGKMTSERIEPVKVVETLTPVSIKETRPGIFIADAGRNLAGWASIRVRGQAGRTITMKFAETLRDNGLVNQDNLRNAKAEDIFTPAGDGEETWEPRFTYHGFRFVQIEGLSGKLYADDIRIKVVRSSVEPSGTFTCSSKLLNDINRMVVNTEASNLFSIPTDCPQRDERQGWLNDLTVRIEQALYNFSLERFYSKFITDIVDTQGEDGTITCVAPFRFGNRPADPVCASFLLLAYRSYQFYGNREIIEKNFLNMKAWVDYLYSRTENGIVDYSYYGDWCPPKEFLDNPDGANSKYTPGRLMSTGYLYHCAKLLSEMAGIIGRDADKAEYEKMALEIGRAFNSEYWDEAAGGYASNNQACNSFAVYLGLADGDRLPRVMKNIADDVKARGYHLATGNLCTKYLLEVLTEHGYPEVAYRIAAQTTYPSWGYMIENGATTLWERWEYLTGGAMNSHNHPMMGSVGSWFYKYVAGIVPDMAGPGFGAFTIHPYIFNDLSFASGEVKTVRGPVRSEWKKDGKFLTLEVTVPENSEATIFVPASDAKSVTESGKAASKVKGLIFINMQDGCAVFRTGSGTYHFKTVI